MNPYNSDPTETLYVKDIINASKPIDKPLKASEPHIGTNTPYNSPNVLECVTAVVLVTTVIGGLFLTAISYFI